MVNEQAKNQAKERLKQSDPRRADHILKYSWRPGQSGNPKGRKKGSVSLTAQYAKLLNAVCPTDSKKRTWGEVIASEILSKAGTGDVRAASEVADRIEGKPMQRVKVEEVDADEVELDFATFSDQELDDFDRLLDKATPIDDLDDDADGEAGADT